MEMMNFGEHLMLDCYGCDAERLNDESLVFRSLIELPERLGMSRLSEPYVFRAEDNAINDPGGWSGVVVITESHISVHTFPKRKFVSIDVYTCKNGMDCESIKGYFTEIFGIGEIEEHFVKRGTRYPTHNIC
ncbi:MAG: adenosylmethionine decarboxylase [Candidatus Moraniibacteriota bacterium]